MILKKLTLANFRSYSSREFGFSPEVNLIVGPNTAGKTNLLEAIYLLATGKSLRAGVESEMIQWGEGWARVEGSVAENTEKYTENPSSRTEFATGHGAEGDLGVDLGISEMVSSDEGTKLEVFIEANENNSHTRKQFKVNGVKKSLGEFQGTLRVVVFSPESLRLVLGRPSRRRSYLNRVLSSLDFNYFYSLEEYRKVIRNRNKLLWEIRERGVDRGRLEYWDRQMFTLGGQICKARQDLIERFSRAIAELGLKIGLVHEPAFLDKGLYEERLPLEIARAATLWGPHRDDFRFQRTRIEQIGTDQTDEEGCDLAIFGSRGEQREAVFALCLAELEVVSQRSDSRPILLLDDIFSELDKAHRKRVLEVLPKQQTIITSAEPELLNSGLMDRAKVTEL